MRYLTLVIGCVLALPLFAAVTSQDLAAIRERFPELELPESIDLKLVQEATDAASLQKAVNDAAENSIILLRNDTPGAVWKLGGTLLLSKQVALVGINSSSKFTNPVSLSGNNTIPLIAVTAGTNKVVKLANFVLTKGNGDVVYKAGGLSLTANGASIVGTCLSFVSNNGIYASDIAVDPNANRLSFYNTTVKQAGTSLYSVFQYGNNITFWHSTIIGTVIQLFPTTLNNCLTSAENTASILTSGETLPHFAPTEGNVGIDAATSTPALLKYDALGHSRKSGERADLGAVEQFFDANMEALSVVALPSGCTEVYIGWKKQSAAITVQYSTDDGKTWKVVPDNELRWPTPRYDTQGIAVDYGWSSVRHVGRTAGWRAKYRLALNVAGETVESLPSAEAVVVASKLPQFSSNPGAKISLVLSMDGYIDDSPEFISYYRQNVDPNGTYLPTMPFYYGKGTDEETAAAAERIWKHVAEDFAPFDINVTTVDLGYDALVKSSDQDEYHGTRVVIGLCLNANDEYVNWFERGGLSLRNSSVYPYHVPAYALVNSSVAYAATTASHEAGHTFGLNHDSGDVWLLDVFNQWILAPSQEYYTGPSVELNKNWSGTVFTNSVQWAPIMGGAVYGDSVEYCNPWCNGGYASYTQAEDLPESEDDIAILCGLWAGKLGTKTGIRSLEYDYQDYGIRLREDDHGDTPASATRVTGPCKVTGLIGKHVEGTTVTADVDCFALNAAAGKLVASIDIPVDIGANLDAKIELLDSSNNVIAMSDLPKEGTYSRYLYYRSAYLEVTLPYEGRYTVRVSGTGRTLCAPTEGTPYLLDGKSLETVTAEQANGSLMDTTGYGSMGNYELKLDYTAGRKSTGYVWRIR